MIAIVATSASAWSTRDSSASRAAGWAPKTLSAPITWSRNRMGKAWTDFTPEANACSTNAGQRERAAPRSVSVTGLPLR